MFSEKRTEGRNIVVQVNMKDEDVVRRFHSILKIGSVISYPEQTKKYLMWRWRAGEKNDVDAFFQILGPWFCERRSEKMHELISARDLSFATRPFGTRR